MGRGRAGKKTVNCAIADVASRTGSDHPRPALPRQALELLAMGADTRTCYLICPQCGEGRTVGHKPKAGHRPLCPACSLKLFPRTRVRHGEARTRLHRAWGNMLTRCHPSPSNRYWRHYAGRGIVVCPEWGTYENFRDWARSNGYADNLELDRIDNDGPYSPENCRWTTRSINMANARKRVKYPLALIARAKTMVFGGKSVAATAAEVGIPRAYLLAILRGKLRLRSANMEIPIGETYDS